MIYFFAPRELRLGRHQTLIHCRLTRDTLASFCIHASCEARADILQKTGAHPSFLDEALTEPDTVLSTNFHNGSKQYIEYCHDLVN